MKVEIIPSVAVGSVLAPPSKSFSHRALICGALSKKSVINGIAFSNDIKATISCLENLGATVNFLSEDSIEIGGLNVNTIKNATLNCLESGSTLRFLIPFAFLGGNDVVYTGSERLFERPLTVYEEIAKNQNLLFQKVGNSLKAGGKLKADNYIIDGSVSSQFVSGLMFVLPLLEDDSKIILSENSASLSYLDITVECLRDFGIVIEKINAFTYVIKGGQTYVSKTVNIEGDFSNSSFLDAFNCLGGNVTVNGLNPLSPQGDKVYREFFDLLSNGSPIIDIKDCPDLAPILFTLSAAKNGATFINTKRLRMKESDRVETMKTELSKFGAQLICEENSVIVKKSSLHTPTCELYGHNDHRIVMSLSILCSVYGGVINGSEAINKSFPDFFEKIKSLGIVVKNYDA